MISVIYFALENIAISKVNVNQDEGDQHEDGHGQLGKKCDVIFQCVFSATFQMKKNCYKLLFTISLRFL